jgi:hypothetical protein
MLKQQAAFFSTLLQCFIALFTIVTMKILFRITSNLFLSLLQIWMFILKENLPCLFAVASRRAEQVWRTVNK